MSKSKIKDIVPRHNYSDNYMDEENIKKYAKKISELGDKALELSDGDSDEAQTLLELTTYLHGKLLTESNI